MAEALDPNGSTRVTAAAVNAIVGDPVLAGVLRAQGFDIDSVVKANAQIDSIQEVAAEAIRVFAPLGWAPSGAMSIPDYTEALRVFATDGPEAAEQILLAAWDSEHRLRRPIKQISVLGLPDKQLHDPFRRRSRLLSKAFDHHQAGAYEASIPILLAQIEGFVVDVADGKLFFSRRDGKKADVIDSATIATMDESLQVVRDLYSAGMDYTDSTGGMSRHGALHGRELGYDTRINSVKAFVLLQALVEWAQPRMGAKIAARQSEQEAASAGSDEVDERGRRLDQREFGPTRESLRWLAICQMGVFRNTGHYDVNRLAIVESSFLRKGLPAKHGIEMHVSSDGQAWWAWRRTVSGWCLGIGAVGPDPLAQWFYDAGAPPAAGPDEAPEAWGGAAHALLPNW
ncbi:hypothetical protein GB931_02795 [Modestobacter sp. I12A-02628]|uniref:Uncharacterized protein n=1 Tax=Goekera deserti TaxID=2497753 RepID=A0A7K3WEQ3_9ACTN|nr:hypothetical protein [Goekera deserti]MPQ96865.1 hypothetical protein [Goekera deserti]NDI46821.1 hypothetical protein [Goekera deserti]NEL54389.1 hypothetical protein [Goekera deserti]